MKKFLITWDAGYGQNEEVIEAENQSEAEAEAYDRWKDEAESNSDYSAQLLTKDLAEDYGLDWDEEE